MGAHINPYYLITMDDHDFQVTHYLGHLSAKRSRTRHLYDGQLFHVNNYNSFLFKQASMYGAMVKHKI